MNEFLILKKVLNSKIGDLDLIDFLKNPTTINLTKNLLERIYINHCIAVMFFSGEYDEYNSSELQLMAKEIVNNTPNYWEKIIGTKIDNNE